MDTKKRLLAATIVVGLAGLLGVGPRENRFQILLEPDGFLLRRKLYGNHE